MTARVDRTDLIARLGAALTKCTDPEMFRLLHEALEMNILIAAEEKAAEVRRANQNARTARFRARKKAEQGVDMSTPDTLDSCHVNDKD